MSKTILVVDDERRIVSMIRAALEQATFRVVTASNGQDALYIARAEKPDLILLDIMMPRMDGHEFMRHYAREGDAPVLLLTAKVEEDDKVIGLELGADDYITKPFSMRELVARVRAHLRRLDRNGQATSKGEVLRSSGLVLDLGTRYLTINDERIDLTRSEFDLLAIFMRAPGRAFTRMDLLDRLRDDAFEGYERTIDLHIKNLRAKIEENPRKPRFIETVYGVGYRFTDTHT